jgi:DNA-binding CsgD family transcriptional regulator
MKRKRLSDYHSQILELVKTHNRKQVAKILNISGSSLNGYLERNNIEYFSERTDIASYHDEIVLAASEGLSLIEIARKLSIESCSLLYHVTKHNIAVTNGKMTVQNRKDVVDKVIELHLAGKTYIEIGKIVGINPKSVPRILDNNNVTKRTILESYRLNYTVSPNAFSDFNDENTVYWYGWLVTDGCISDKNSISLALKGEDGYIVEAFKVYMGSTAKCTHGAYFHKQLQRDVSSSSFSIRDKATADRLRAQGMDSRKSCKEKSPSFDWLYGENAAVFWRACLEGDGYIKKDVHHTCIELVGSEELLEGFRTYCETIIGVKPNKKLRKRSYGDPNFRLLAYSGIDSRNIMRKLWSSGSIFLKRKQLIVNNVLDYWNEKDNKK